MTQVVHLGEILTLNYGRALPERDRIPGEYRVYGSGGDVGSHNESLVKGPGIIVGRKGTIGSVTWSDSDFFPIDTTYYATINDPSISLKFAFYLLKSLPLGSMNTDSAVPGLNRNNAYRLSVNILDKQTREQAVQILSLYDNLIENNRRRIALLEESARLLYREWFVQFRFPGAIFELSKKIPTNTTRKTFDDLCNFENGYAFKSSTYDSEGEYKIVTIKNVHDAKFEPDTESRIVSIPQQMPKHCMLNEKDILLSLTGNVGRVCIVHGRNFFLNQRVAKIRPKNKTWRPFLYWLFNNPNTRTRLENLSTGTAQLNLSPVKLKAEEIILPPEHIIEDFCTITENSFEQIANLWKVNSKLAIARDLLLPRLMDGRITL